MKQIYIVLFCTVLTATASAKIWRVNNNFNVVADFTGTTAAFNSASVQNGDTIHIEASATAYSDFTISKRLTVIGTGYFLTENAPMVANPKTQANPATSYMTNIYFAPGSKGSSVSGISCYRITLDDSLITVQRCIIYTAVYVNNTRNIYADTIRQNFISGVNSTADNSFKAENLIIYNNIFTGSYPLSFYAGGVANNNGYFINNSCVGYSYGFGCTNFTFQNNIFYAPDFGPTLSSNVFFNCISNNASIPNTNGNQLNTNLDDVFMGWNSSSGFSSDGRFALKAGSPAIGAGVLNGGTVDCGAFGGPAPYIRSGMPSVPSIYTFTAPATVSSGTTTMNVTVSTTTH